MPVIRDQYQVPLDALWSEEYDLEPVRENRRRYSTELNELHQLNKELQKERKFELCKALKEEIKHLTQCEKAATIVIDWYEKRTSELVNFPKELSPLLDHEFRAATFGRVAERLIAVAC